RRAGGDGAGRRGGGGAVARVRARKPPPLRTGQAMRPAEVGDVLLDEKTIQLEVARLGARISEDYANSAVHLGGVLKGAAVFAADLIRALAIPATMDFISIVPYARVTASGVVRIRKDLDEPIEDRHVIVVEGICA